ncbi:exported hypothetical protein [Burkholderia diffusa]|nr:exported hypothetical protein [Burkholderia diffusa]
MLRTSCRSILVVSLALLTATAEAHPRLRVAADLIQAKRLVEQSRKLVRDAHRQEPQGFGRHEAKAADLLRRAELQLNEANDFRIYNAKGHSRLAHRASRGMGSHLVSRVEQQRKPGVLRTMR